MSKQYEKEFKENAVRYHHDHPELTIKECAEKLGVPYDTYHGWLNSVKVKGDNAFRGSGNYSSDEAKEIARLKRELRDTQDALEILKKPSAFWENNRNNIRGSFGNDRNI